MTKRLAIIDGKSVFYRGYYAMPNLSMGDGTPTGGVYGFTALALELILPHGGLEPAHREVQVRPARDARRAEAHRAHRRLGDIRRRRPPRARDAALAVAAGVRRIDPPPASIAARDLGRRGA